MSYKPGMFSMLLLCLLLCGCLGTGGSTATRYYVIDPVESGVPARDRGEALAIEIIDLNVPQYLERFHIATRHERNRLHFSESHQWGENLRKNLLRTMARNLARYLSTTDIGTPQNRSSSLADYRLQIHIDQFEQQTDRSIVLSARWQLSKGDAMEAMGVNSANLVSTHEPDKGDYDAMVSAMQELYGELSSRIAASIVAAEAGDNQ